MKAVNLYPCDTCDTLVEWGGKCKPCGEAADAKRDLYEMHAKLDAITCSGAVPSWAEELAEVLRYVLVRLP